MGGILVTAGSLSIPMFIISGQVRYDTTSRYALQYTETPLRAMGDQEYDIV